MSQFLPKYFHEHVITRHFKSQSTKKQILFSSDLSRRAWTKASQIQMDYPIMGKIHSFPDSSAKTKSETLSILANMPSM